MQIPGTVFKNQLSVGETAFFQCETPILVNAFICVVLQMAECAWNRMKTEGLLRFSETLLPVSLSLTVTLAYVAMLLSQLNVIFQTPESLFHYLERLLLLFLYQIAASAPSPAHICNFFTNKHF